METAIIRLLNNDDLLPLLGLNAEFYKTLPVPQNTFSSVANLIKDIQTQEDFKAWGLFDTTKFGKEELVGFVTGYAISKKVFYFSGLYVIIRLNRNLKKLIEHCFDHVEKDGYTAWEVDCTNKTITSMMEKYGAAPIYTRYSKMLG